MKMLYSWTIDSIWARTSPACETRAAYDGFSYLLPFEKIRIITTQVSRGAVEERLRRRDRLFVIVSAGLSLQPTPVG